MPDSSTGVETRRRLERFAVQTQDDYTTFIGFPAALDIDYSALQPYTTLFLNNVGDPLVKSWHGAQSKAFEREVVDFCAQLFRMPAGQYWGYVTNGSTECNLYALYLAREKLPGATVYYSEAAHYSIPKNIHLLGIKGRAVRTDKHGEMDYQHLKTLLHATAGEPATPTIPAIVIATIGTTMTEAKDNVATIKELLNAANVPHHIHADAALAGVYTALLTPHHPFDFVDGADSIGISGHKFFGTPTPSGVIIVHKADKEALHSKHNYTGSIDSTISGSRNGHTPLFLWYAIHLLGIEGLRQRAVESQNVAAYVHQRLRDIGWETWRNPQALTVMLASPPLEYIRKWQLATHEGWSHIICMPGVTRVIIDDFIQDLASVQKTSGLAAEGAARG